MAKRRPCRSQMPEMGESVTEGIVLEWHVAEGDFVNEGDTVVEVSTDKVDAEVPAPADGVITKLLVSVDDEVPVGAPWPRWSRGGTSEGSTVGRGSCRGRGGTAGGGSSLRPRPPLPRATRRRRRSELPRAPTEGDGVRATPVARRVAEANGVDLGSVAGSGPGAKVTKEDVLAAANGGGTGALLRARRRRCGGRRRCWPRRWTRAGRCRPRPRSGRSPSTRSTPSARRSTGCSKSAG